MFGGMDQQRATNGEANADKTAERNARLRRMGFKPGKTGRQIPNRVLELYDNLALEFGGDAMSASTRVELMLAAHLIYKVERTKDADIAAKAGNSARHVLESLRRRVKLTPPPKDLRNSPLRSRLLRNDVEPERA
jgi:hypothetical protein